MFGWFKRNKKPVELRRFNVKCANVEIFLKPDANGHKDKYEHNYTGWVGPDFDGDLVAYSPHGIIDDFAKQCGKTGLVRTVAPGCDKGRDGALYIPMAKIDKIIVRYVDHWVDENDEPCDPPKNETVDTE